jgi:hypothetical protein
MDDSDRRDLEQEEIGKQESHRRFLERLSNWSERKVGAARHVSTRAAELFVTVQRQLIQHLSRTA